MTIPSRLPVDRADRADRIILARMRQDYDPTVRMTIFMVRTAYRDKGEAIF